MLHSTDGRSRPFLRCAARRLAVLSTAALAALLPLAASPQSTPPAEILLERGGVDVALLSAREAYTCHAEENDLGGRDFIVTRVDPLARTTEWRSVVLSADADSIRSCALDYHPVEDVVVAAWDAAINVRGIYVGAIDPVTGNAVARDTGRGTASSLADANIVVDDNGSVFVLHNLQDRYDLLAWPSAAAMTDPEVAPKQLTLSRGSEFCFTWSGSGDAEAGPDGKAWLSYGVSGTSCFSRGFAHVAFELDGSGNLVESCTPGSPCHPFEDSFFDDNDPDGSSARIYADWIGIPYNGSPNREIMGIYPDVFGTTGRRLHARVMEAGVNPEPIAYDIGSTIDVETVGSEWILARRNTSDSLDIHRFAAGVESDGNNAGLAEMGPAVTIDSTFCGTETALDNDAIRIDNDRAGRGLAAVTHFTCDDPAATQTAFGSLVVQLIDPDFPDADLAVTIDDGRTEAMPGETVTYTVVTTNAGPDANDHVYLDTALPDAAACTWTSTAAAGATGNTPGGTGDLGEVLAMPAASTVTYTIDCPIDLLATGTRIADATIDSPASDDPPVEPDADNAATDTTALVDIEVADVGVTLDASTDLVGPGNTLTFTATVTNPGPDAVGSVALGAVPSAGLTLIETVGCTQDPNGLPDCDLGGLGVGASADVDFVFSVDAGAGAILSLDATVESDLPDPDATDDSASAEVAFDDDVVFSNGYE